MRAKLMNKGFGIMRSYTMRLKTTGNQSEKLSDLLEHLCVLYNSALEQRTKIWKESKTAIQYKDQQRALTAFRQGSPEVKEYPACIQRDPLRRVDKAFKAFFGSGRALCQNRIVYLKE